MTHHKTEAKHLFPASNKWEVVKMDLYFWVNFATWVSDVLANLAVVGGALAVMAAALRYVSIK